MSWHRGHPDDIAIVMADAMLSYAELDARVAEKNEVFRHSGIAAGHRIALYESTSIDYIITLIALIESGVVVCPINTRWPEATVSEAIAGINAVLLQDVLARGHITQSIEASHILTDHRWATVVFTSGSSGTPKAAVHSLANHRSSAQASNRNILLKSGDHWLLSLPLYHVGGLGIVFRCLEAGATIAIPKNNQHINDSILELKPSHISLVSTLLYRMLDDEAITDHLSKMKAVLMGGSGLAPQLIQKAHEKKINVHASYGMTEMSTQITCTQPTSILDELLTSGKPLLVGSIRINEADEIYVSGPCLFQGYLREDTLELPTNEHGFFRTGDTGHFDGNNNLCVTGRLDRMFVSGGENIQPAVIEDTLCKIEGVLQAVVFAVKDAEFGERPGAFVRMDIEWSGDQLQERVREWLPGYMVPIRILPWVDGLDGDIKPNEEMLQRLWGEYIL